MSAFTPDGRYDERAALAHDQARLANPTEVLFQQTGQFNGLSPLDEAVAVHRENQRALDEARREVLGRMHGEIMDLKSALVLKDEAIALLRDALAESEAELDAMRGRLEREHA